MIHELIKANVGKPFAKGNYEHIFRELDRASGMNPVMFTKLITSLCIALEKLEDKIIELEIKVQNKHIASYDLPPTYTASDTDTNSVGSMVTSTVAQQIIEASRTSADSATNVTEETEHTAEIGNENNSTADTRSNNEGEDGSGQDRGTSDGTV